MKTIYLFLMMLTPQGEIAQQGYSQINFESYEECHAFVERTIESLSENVAAFQWKVDFTFRALMTDGSSTMGRCLEQDQT